MTTAKSYDGAEATATCQECGRTTGIPADDFQYQRDGFHKGHCKNCDEQVIWEYEK